MSLYPPEGEQEVIKWREAVSRDVGTFPPSPDSQQEIEQWRTEVSNYYDTFPPNGDGQELRQWREQISRSI